MNIDDKAASITKSVKRWFWTGLGVGAAAIIGLNSYHTTDLGYNYVVQSTLFGDTRVISEVGIHLKVPFFTRITEYKQVATVGFGEKVGGEFTRNLAPVGVTFADTYNGEIPATFRFRLPRGDQQMILLHEEFRGFENLVDSLLVKNAVNVTVVTATQYTGEEFFQGGLNSFKVKLEDQLSGGLYVTERQQVQVEESDFAAVSSDNSDSQKIETRTRNVQKQVVQLGEDGTPLRSANPLEQYGITVSQVTIDKPIPEPKLDELLVTKKTLVAKRISAEQEIITAQSEANAAQQKAEIAKRLALQTADKEKQLAVIAGQQRVAVEQQQASLETVQKNKEASLAVIDKNKELQIAIAERDIQSANADAAKFEALAIREKGLAEAEVDKAKLDAKQSAKDIYLAEMQRDISFNMYSNLSQFRIEMPQNVIMGSGSGKMPSNLDVLTSYGALGIMNQLTDQKLMAPQQSN